ncbi:hypothetical protein DFQ28_004557 [Apophysomyces sp. BC1034]|nr:hypothetical protein DFQ30_006234 [Apophysomyces sp. BC1015]KAG0177150.1 hypothetical protein DFQ29_005188 [Apophysomyces sp. BC1021]KAG0188644.1 hypothetical protein DFQ28_004557 [Apophysomyces sp. BC1034]
MEKSLSDYDRTLEELDRQREQLERVVQKMGQEWEESGAGIGWLGSLHETKINPTLLQKQPTSPSDYIASLDKESLLAQSLITTPVLTPDATSENDESKRTPPSHKRQQSSSSTR